MLIYLALALLPVLLGLFTPDLKKSQGQRYLLYFICGLAMFLVMGLRTPDLGSVDSLNYYSNYLDATVASSFSTFFRPDHFEIGYQFCVYIMARFLDEPQWIFVFSSALYIISTIYFIEHNSDDPPLSLTAYISLGLMTFQMQGMRQAIAMSICLFAYEQAKRKHLVKFLLLVGIAALFHQTAIVFLPVYIFCRIKVSQRNLVLTVLAAGIILLLSEQLIDLANTIFDRDYTSTVESGGFIATAIYFIILFVCYLHYRKNAEAERSSLIFVLMIATGCYVMRYIGAQAAERISFYFAFSQIALLPNALKLMIREHRRYMYILIVFLAVGLFAYRLSTSYFIPYKFFWEVPLA